MNTAIYFHPEGYSTRGQKLMGRHAAGESFLKAYLRYADTETHALLVDDKRHASAFAEVATQLGRRKPLSIIETRHPAGLAKVGNVFHPGPGIGAPARQRSFYGHAQWSLCGVTHTTSSDGAMDSIADLLTAPVQPWDALICTSRAVKHHVENILGAQTEYLKERLGIRKIVLPLMPVIPLGIHCDDFEHFERAEARNKLGIGEHEHVALFVGRLSFHAKAHPLAMYRALELVVRKHMPGQKVVLVECGWFANESIERAFEEAARVVCPSVRVIRLDGRISSNRQHAWGCADVFCSLSDNIQETFGIVPIEAMAAGLPVVVSDWDGYRDTVRHGIDGFRIATTMPRAGTGEDLSRRYASGADSYDMYCGFSCSLVSVDIHAAAESLAALFRSPQLRLKMGREGRARARATYDWSTVMNDYFDLWQEQGRLRIGGGVTVGGEPDPWPARMDPFKSFAHYATATLDEKTQLTLGPDSPEDLLTMAEEYLQLRMVNFARRILPSVEEVAEILSKLDRAGVETVAGLVNERAPAGKEEQIRTLAWMLKAGLIRRPKLKS